MQILQPSGWSQPKGYANGVVAEGKQVFIAGQIGCDERGQVHATDFADQARQALLNTVAVLAEADAKPEHIVRMTWYVTDKHAYLTAQKTLAQIYQQIIGPHYPAMTLVQVSALIAEQAQVEIETTAVIPDRWRVMRQDDNGNVFIVAGAMNKAGADALIDEYRRKGHKQFYWTERDQHQSER